MRISRVVAAIAGAVLALAACTPTQEPGTDGERGAAAPLEAGGRDCRHLDRMVEGTRRGYVPIRSPELAPIPTEPNYIGKASDPVHTGPWDYLAEVP
ncbi:MAG: hypothetical protein ACLGIB_12850, partial [Actinomycetota bacterium]